MTESASAGSSNREADDGWALGTFLQLKFWGEWNKLLLLSSQKLGCNTCLKHTTEKISLHYTGSWTGPKSLEVGGSFRIHDFWERQRFRVSRCRM